VRSAPASTATAGAAAACNYGYNQPRPSQRPSLRQAPSLCGDNWGNGLGNRGILGLLLSWHLVCLSN
jgi:hypothetical protein